MAHTDYIVYWREEKESGIFCGWQKEAAFDTQENAREWVHMQLNKRPPDENPILEYKLMKHRQLIKHWGS